MRHLIAEHRVDGQRDVRWWQNDHGTHTIVYGDERLKCEREDITTATRCFGAMVGNQLLKAGVIK